MSKKFQLQIPEPCHESWDKMTNVEKGRFCNSCQKVVHDFTGMSDTQLIAFFKKPSTGSVCGRFYNDQLDRNLAMRGKRMPWLKYFLQLLVPAFLLSYKAKAQGKPRLIGDTVHVDQKGQSRLITDDTTAKPGIDLKSKLNGKVVDEKGVGIPYASIVVKGSRFGVAADQDGNFSINSSHLKPSTTLVLSCIGFQTKEIIIDTTKNGNTCNIGMVAMENALMGAVSVGIIVPWKKKREPVKLIQRVFKDTAAKFFRVFPNPVVAGGTIKVELNKTVAGEYHADLINIDGQLVHSAMIIFAADDQSRSYSSPTTTPGTYFLRLTNKKTGQKNVEKIIIQ